jgi:hypothetical protein
MGGSMFGGVVKRIDSLIRGDVAAMELGSAVRSAKQRRALHRVPET